MLKVGPLVIGPNSCSHLVDNESNNISYKYIAWCKFETCHFSIM